MVQVTMPKLSMNMSEGIILEWVVDDRARIEKGEHIAEIESEKATAMVEAPASGILSIEVAAGDSMPVGAVLATIETADSSVSEEQDNELAEAASSQTQSSGASLSSEEQGTADGERVTFRATPAARRLARNVGVSLESLAATQNITQITPDDVRSFAPTEERSAESSEMSSVTERDGPSATEVRASPAARMAARERGIELQRLTGSGPDGAIVVRDVKSSAPASPQRIPPASETGSATGSPPVRDQQELTGVRSVVASRLSQSWREAPHVTVNRDIPIERVQEAKDTLDRELNVDISLNDFFLLGLARSLEDHPDLNATFEDKVHTRYERVDVAIAVDTERGLLTPVLRNVGEKTLRGIATERTRIVEEAIEDTLSPERLDGGTFTMTNLGTFGVTSFTPIINPPQVGILGVSAIQPTPRREGDGEVVFEDTVTVSLSFDHRVIDGADGAQFLQSLEANLSRPYALAIG